MANVLILGAGMMGSALSVVVADRGHVVDLVGTHLDESAILALQKNHRHPGLPAALPDSVRPAQLGALSELAPKADVIALGVSSQGVRWAAEQLRDFVRPEVPIVMVSKGLEWTGQELRILPDVFLDALPPNKRSGIYPAAIAGPCIAGELARRVETCVVVTGRSAPVLRTLVEALEAPYYHVLAAQDAVGVEVCAALKNAYAMGIAFGQGLHEKRGGTAGSVAHHNYEAAVFAQAVMEMQRAVVLCGGQSQSAVGLPGVGDLNVTCNGGRTGRFGRLLGLGIGKAQAIERMQGATLECLEILDMMRRALDAWQDEGKLGPQGLPLLRHLIAVALDDAPVDVPFASFSAVGLDG